MPRSVCRNPLMNKPRISDVDAATVKDAAMLAE